MSDEGLNPTRILYKKLERGMIDIKYLFEEFHKKGYFKNKLVIAITLLMLAIGPTAAACMSSGSESMEVPISDNQAKALRQDLKNLRVEKDADIESLEKSIRYLRDDIFILRKSLKAHCESVGDDNC